MQVFVSWCCTEKERHGYCCGMFVFISLEKKCGSIHNNGQALFDQVLFHVH